MQDAQGGTFVYANPRTIHWGPASLAGCLEQELRMRDAQRVFVVTTRSVASNADLGGMLKRLLGRRNVAEFATIPQHAPAAAVAAAARAAATAEPDLLVSLGGGSAIDATKAIAFALGTGLDLGAADAVEQARAFRPAVDDLLPHLAIPTTLSAAELSGLAGFTTEADHQKVGLRGEALVPRVVFFDAALTVHTPLELWLSSGIRAVDHAVETLLAPGNHPLPDTLALEALRRLQASLLLTRAQPADITPRTESQLGAWFSFSLPGPAAGGLSHTLGKRIGARHAIPHGISSCLLLPHVMRYLAPTTAAAQTRIAEALGVRTEGLSSERAAACAADAVAELIERLGLPRHLSGYHLSAADLESAARPVASDALPLDDLVGIYTAAL